MTSNEQANIIKLEIEKVSGQLRPNILRFTTPPMKMPSFCMDGLDVVSEEEKHIVVDYPLKRLAVGKDLKNFYIREKDVNAFEAMINSCLENVKIEAYKQGAIDAIKATKIEQIIYYTKAELMGRNPLTEEQKINFAERVGKESARMQACSEQENKAKRFLESLKDNSGSEIPIN